MRSFKVWKVRQFGVTNDEYHITNYYDQDALSGINHLVTYYL